MVFLVYTLLLQLAKSRGYKVTIHLSSEKCDQMADPSGDFSLWNLLRVIHLE
jgi:hypothetical protein